MRGVLLAHVSLRFAKMVAAMSFAVTAIALLIDFFSFASKAADLPGYTVAAGFALSALHMPSTMASVVPFVVQFATVALLTRLAATRELVVFRSVGISAVGFIVPLCVMSFLFGILAVGVLDPLAARCIPASRDMERKIGGIESQFAASASPLWMANRGPDGLVVIGAMNQRQRGLDLSGVTYLRFSADGIAERIEAREARIVHDQLEFRDAAHFEGRRLTEQVDRLSIESPFTEAAFRSEFGDAREVSILALGGAIASARQAGHASLPLELRYYSLLTLPLLLATMVLISAPVSIRFERTGGSGVLVGSTILSGYAVYGVTVVTSGLALAGRLAPLLAVMVPIVIGAGVGIFWLLLAEDG